jgi:uncharacterized repeat protein (TIGR01451 family)
MMQRLSRQILAVTVLSLALCGAVIGTQTVDQKQSDGLMKVYLGDVFERGETKIEEADFSELPTLPRGFVSLTKKAYRVTTTAVASGPYNAMFKVNSVTDEQAFKNLRILQLEPDRFDPDSYVWVDRTAPPDHPKPAHDFRQKTIISHSEGLDPGIYMVAKLVPKIEASTDLEITARSTTDQIQMPGNITFSISVKNNGPNGATNVGAKMDQSRVGGSFISATPSQGTCKYFPSGVYCKLGQLAAGAAATIKLIVAPEPDFAGSYESTMLVAGDDKDSKPENNETKATVLTIKDPNEPPVVGLEYSPRQRFFQPGETIHLKATASDPDGSIKKVEFFDISFERSLGVGASTNGKDFTLSVNGLANGEHVLFAVATDDRGRETTSYPHRFFVNGPIRVKILEPKAGAVLKPGEDLTLTAEAVNGHVKTLKFFAHGRSLGEATRSHDNRFTLKLRDLRRSIYTIVAVAEDESGLISKTPPIELTASDRPMVKIAAPAEGSGLIASANVEISVNCASFDSRFYHVEVYANGVLIKRGSASEEGKYTFNWTDVKAGKYTLKAVAIDALQRRGESSTVNIVVKDRKVKN